jgi:hypothetical protein
MSGHPGGKYLIDLADMMIPVLARATALLAVAVAAGSANAGLARPEQGGGGTPLSPSVSPSPWITR